MNARAVKAAAVEPEPIPVICERWKQDIYERHLREAGYTFTSKDAPQPNCVQLDVVTTDAEALAVVTQAAGVYAWGTS